jgi:enoyl-[acyl-carrier protein] reductase I
MSTAISAPDSVTIEDVGAMAASLVSDFAGNVTGSIAYVDAGYHVMS